jgi:hypothetical protein
MHSSDPFSSLVAQAEHQRLGEHVAPRQAEPPGVLPHALVAARAIQRLGGGVAYVHVQEDVRVLPERRYALAPGVGLSLRSVANQRYKKVACPAATGR